MFGSNEIIIRSPALGPPSKKEPGKSDPIYCFLEAAMVVEILNRKPAFLSGGLDKGGAPVLSVLATEGISQNDLRDVISYLGTVPDDKLRSRGITIVVDGRGLVIDELDKTLSAIQASTLSSRINAVFIVRKEGLKEKQRATELKRHSFNFDFLIVHVTLQKLYKYIHPFQLTEEFAGSYLYGHEQWLKKRLAVEKYLKECSSMSKHIESCHNLLSHRSSHFEKDNAQRVLREVQDFYEANGPLPTVLLERGDKLLDMLKTDLDTGFKSRPDISNLDVNGQNHEQVHQAMSHLKNQQNRFHQLWLEKEQFLKELVQLSELDKHVRDVTTWLYSKGENGLFITEVGTSYSSALAILKEHQEIELRCTETFGQYADISHKATDMITNDHCRSDKVTNLKRSIDHHCQKFAMCLQRKRDIVETVFSLFSQIQQMKSKMENCKVKLSITEDMESFLECECTLQMYRHWKESIDLVSEESLRLGSKLLDMLQRPYVTPKGCPAIINAAKHIGDVKKALAMAEADRCQFLELLEAKQLRVTQQLQMYQCERDAKQAVSWLEDLCSLIALSNTQVGASIKEVEQTRFEHQKFEETAKGAYDYGRKLLETAVFLRQSFKINLIANTYIVNMLISNWQKFLCGSQERTVRLSLVRTLYLTFEKLHERMDGLEKSLKDDLTAFGLIRKSWIAQRHKTKWTKIQSDIQQAKKAKESLMQRLEKPVIQGYKVDSYVRDENTVDEIERHIASLIARVEAMETRYFSDETSSEAHSYVTARSNISSPSSTITGNQDIPADPQPTKSFPDSASNNPTPSMFVTSKRGFMTLMAELNLGDSD